MPLDGADSFESSYPSQLPEKSLVGFHQQSFGHSKIHGTKVIPDPRDVGAAET